MSKFTLTSHCPLHTLAIIYWKLRKARFSLTLDTSKCNISKSNLVLPLSNASFCGGIASLDWRLLWIKVLFEYYFRPSAVVVVYMRFNNIILQCFNTLHLLTYLGVISIFLFNVLDKRLKQTSKPVTYKKSLKLKKNISMIFICMMQGVLYRLSKEMSAIYTCWGS